MIRLVRENAITDLRKEIQGIDFSKLDDKKTGFYRTEYSRYNGRRTRGEFVTSEKNIKDELIKWIENLLRQDYSFDFNAEQLNLHQIPKPAGSTRAKKSPNILIGICTWNGNAAVIGNGKFYKYYSGLYGYSNNGWDNQAPDDPVPDYSMKNNRVSFRDLWDSLDLWFEIVPENEDTYQTRSSISNTRIPRLTRYKDDKMDKVIYDFERELYDPELAREKYAERLKDIRTRRQYEDILNSVETVNDRIRSIDFGNPILDEDPVFSSQDIQRLRSKYRSLVTNIKDLNRNLDNGWESSIKRYASWARESLEEVNDLLTNVFGVQ